jgi:hypothetical protein
VVTPAQSLWRLPAVSTAGTLRRLRAKNSLSGGELAYRKKELDHYIRAGAIVSELPFPHILGADVAATIRNGVKGDAVRSLGADLWKVLRRRATHHRLFETIAQLKETLRNSLCYDQTLKHRVLSVIQSTTKRTKLSTACIDTLQIPL